MVDVEILLVEDDNIEAMDIKRTLESFGYSVSYVASRGEEAVSKALELMPDLVLMDIILKGELNGIQAASKIKNLNIPVIFLTAHSEEPTVQKAKLTEPHGYLIKPYDVSELRFAIELALFKSKQEKKLKESEENFRAMAENANDGILIASGEGIHVYANQMAAEITGYSIEELIGTKMADLSLSKRINKHMGRYGALIAGKTVNPLSETVLVRKDGNTVPVEFTSARTVWKGKPAVIALFRDITERKLAESEQKRLNRELQAISKCNETLLRAVDEETLLNDVCRIICDEAGYRLAWVGYAEHDEDKTIRPVAWAGYNSGYIAEAKLKWSEDTEHGQGPAGIVIRSGELIYVQDFKTDALMAPWRESALQHGYRSGIALPLKDKKNKTFGALLIYSAEPNAINPDEIWLMKELAGNLAFGITSLREQKNLNKVEESLKHERTLLSQITDTSPVGITVVNREGQVTFANKQAERVFGLKKDEITQRRYNAADWHITGYDSNPVPDDELPFRRVMSTGKSVYGVQHAIKRPDGRSVYLSINGAPILNDLGEMDSVVLTIEDITQRKKAEKELEVANLYNRSLIEASLDPLVTIGADGQITDVNKATEIITGCSRSKLIGTDFSDYFTEPDKAREGYQQVFKEGFVRDYPLEIKNRDGHVTPVLYNASVYKDEFGEVVGVFAAARDITGRKKAEEDLRLAGLYNRSLIETTLDPLVTIGPDGKVTDVNKATEQVTGFSRNEIIGTDFSNYFTEPEKARQGYEQVFKEGFVRDYPLEIQDKDGNITSVLYNASVYKDESGEVVGVFAAARDITERRKAEEKIQLLADVVESSDDAIITKSLDGRITSWNKGAESVYGYSSEELVGKNISILAPTPLKNEINELIENIKRGEHVIHYETIRMRKDGKKINVSLTLSPILDSAGRLTGVSTIARDITQRKLTEEAIQKSEEKYRNIFEESFDGLFITSPEGKILDMNKKGIEMFGYDNKDEILLLDLKRDVYADPSDRERILALVNKEGSAEYEIVVKKKNGETMITQSSLTAVPDEKGVITSYRGIIRDITERKMAENAILQAKEEWEKTFDAVPDLIAILDTNYHIIRANKAMADKFGVTPQETVGITCFEAVHGLNHPPSFCPHRKLILDGQEHTTEVHEDILGGDFIVSVSPLYDSDGELMGSVHVARDITDRKRAEDEVKKSLEEKEALLSEIHHRVKNNMQIISSLLNIQSQYVKEKESVDVLHESQDRVKAMATIYEKLYLSEDLNRINFQNYIQSLVNGLFYSHTIGENQITPIIEIDNIMLNIETAIPCGLIISELISNSLKHAFPHGRKGEVRVSLQFHEGKYDLKISDDGIGFPDEIDFKNTNTLGLRLVNNLIKQIEGIITLDKTNGTEFRVNFKELEYKKRF